MTETPKISAPDLLARYQQGQTPGRNFVVVDLRSTDFAGGTVKGSLNIPMQTLEYGIPALYSLVRAARIDEVIFFCGSCGSRGPKGAVLFSEYAKQQQQQQEEGRGDGPSLPTGIILTGGIKGWARGGEEYTEYMDGYEPGHWGIGG